MVTVTTTTGTVRIAGTILEIDEGVLTVADDTGVAVAVFAPGVWQSAVVAQP